MSVFVVPRLRDRPRSTVVVPGSKSLANRALVIAGLVGQVTLTNVPDGDDTVAMCDALRLLGADITREGSLVRVGVPIDRSRRSSVTLDARLAGTTSRFLVAVSALIEGETTVTGDQALRRRPMDELALALSALGASVKPLGEPGHLPLVVARAACRGGKVALSGEVSSQFLTALMLVAPLFDDGVSIDVTGDLVSASYVGLTRRIMSHFGIDVVTSGGSIDVPHGGYVARDYAVAPDASSASYPLALAAIHGSSLRIDGLGRSRDQGDFRILEILESCGCHVVEDGDDVTVTGPGEGELRPVDVDMRDCSDLVPTVAVVAALARGTSRIRGVGFIRNKESDRIGDLARELRVLGCQVDEEVDGLSITGGSLHGGRVSTHHDHRLAMAFGLIGTLVDDVALDDETVVSKSWPSYWTDMGITNV